jgi:hypothetical protein
MRIESKEQARTRGFLSPDRAEALTLALCRPPQKFEYYTSNNPPAGFRSPSPDSQGYSYSAELDDDDLPPNVRRIRSRFDGFAPSGIARYLRRHRGGF